MEDDSGKKDIEKRIEDHKKQQDEANENMGIDKTSDKFLIYLIIGIIILFIVIISLQFIFPKQKIMTIDDLHEKNLNGKLDEDEGYVYNGYSFIKFNDFWYSQVQKGNKKWDVPFRFGPKDLSDIKIEGFLDDSFLNSSEIFMTFDPLGVELQYIVLAVGDMDQSLLSAFGITPIAACDKNETNECKKRPIVTCDNKDKAVIYYKRNATLRVIGEGNCLIIQGMQFDIVKGVDRVLMRLYGIMD